MDKQTSRRIPGKEVFDDILFDGLLHRIFRHLIADKSVQLWSFDEIRERLHLQQRHAVQGIQQVDLNKIVGSVGRSDDFTRTFLPKDKHMRDRWSAIYAAAVGTGELPPVELYRVGDAYFVVDGNHRFRFGQQVP